MSKTPFSLFISDLHLTPERPLPVRLFERFIKEIAPGAQALYILGDFFEAWVGDDVLDQPFNLAICETLKSLASSGVEVYFMPGNRDFLAGSKFATAANLTLLADPAEVALHGTPTLLAHGDQFCTDDADYQAFRRLVRDPEWQRQFLAQPLPQRLALANSLRERSEHAKAGKQPQIMDVNPASVEAMLKSHAPRRIIHGHTHRPARHELQVDGRICERWVLPDWYETGGYLTCDAAGCRLSSFP
jgi:UDP-2,3-diacylglucosamine hydrolase